MKRTILILAGITLGFIASFIGIASAGRSSSGTYSLPNTLQAPNPVLRGTTITSAWANGTLNDLAAEMTNSLDRNGRGGMLQPLRTVDGTLTGPAYSFTSEPSIGLSHFGPGDLRVAVAGGWAQRWTSGGAQFANGTAAAPALSFINDTASGLALASTGNVQMSIAGVPSTGWSASGLTIFDRTTSYGVTVAAPALTASYTVKLPASAPASTQPLVMDSGGNLTAGGLPRGGLPAVGQQISNPVSPAWTTGAGTYSDITNLTVTLTTTGRPVIVFVQPDGVSGHTGHMWATPNSSSTCIIWVQLVRDSTPIAVWRIGGMTNAAPQGTDYPTALNFIDTAPPAGAHTYKLQMAASYGTGGIDGSTLTAYEL